MQFETDEKHIVDVSLDSVDVFMRQVAEKVVEVAQVSPERIMEHIAFGVPQERDHQRIAAPRLDIPEPLIITRKRVPQRTVEASAPQALNETVGVHGCPSALFFVQVNPRKEKSNK